MADGTSLISAPKWYLVTFIVASLEYMPPIPIVMRYVQREENEKLAVEKSLAIFRKIFYNEKRKQYVDPDGVPFEMIGSFYLEIKDPYRQALETMWLQILAMEAKQKPSGKDAKGLDPKKGATIHKLRPRSPPKKDPPEGGDLPPKPDGNGKKT